MQLARAHAQERMHVNVYEVRVAAEAVWDDCAHVCAIAACVEDEVRKLAVDCSLKLSSLRPWLPEFLLVKANALQGTQAIAVREGDSVSLAWTRGTALNIATMPAHDNSSAEVGLQVLLTNAQPPQRVPQVKRISLCLESASNTVRPAFADLVYDVSGG
jgi:hypothetical protein